MVIAAAIATVVVIAVVMPMSSLILTLMSIVDVLVSVAVTKYVNTLIHNTAITDVMCVLMTIEMMK